LELCGYSLLYPLTDDAGRAIAEARIHSAKELGYEAMLPDFAAAKHLYIGMVLGSPRGDARRRIKAQLRAGLMRRIKEGAVNLVFARPASPAGQKLMLRLEAQLGQHLPKRRKRRFGLRPRSAHRPQVVGVAHQHPVSALRPLPVEPLRTWRGRRTSEPAETLNRVVLSGAVPAGG
jgi:hypothetical protein